MPCPEPFFDSLAYPATIILQVVPQGAAEALPRHVCYHLARLASVSADDAVMLSRRKTRNKARASRPDDNCPPSSDTGYLPIGCWQEIRGG